MPLNPLLGAAPLAEEDHVWTLIKSYEETCRNLRELRAQILSLQAQESVLETKRISIHSFLAMASRPARDMVFATSDIMERIFAYAIRPTAEDKMEDAFYTKTIRHSNAYPVVLAIAGVCRLWRATAIHAPSLWQRIVFSGWREAPETDSSCASLRLRFWLRRSFPLPLTIDWNDDESSDDASRSSEDSYHYVKPAAWVMSLFNSLVAHSTRWQAASFRIPFSDYCPSFPLDLLNLKDLHLHNLGDDSIPVLGRMPSLRSLALSGWDVCEKVFPWQQLRSLHIFTTDVISHQAIQACHSVERLYINMGDYIPPFDIGHTTELPSLRHLSIFFPLEFVPFAFLNLGALEILTVRLSDDDIPVVSDSVEFFERCLRLSTLQINFHKLNSQGDTPFTSLFCSSTVRILKLKLTRLLGLDSCILSCALQYLTLDHLAEQFSALEEVHIDITSDREDDHALSIESVAFTALKLATIDTQKPSLRSVWLHIPASFIESLSHVLKSSSKLHVSSTSLDFDDIGANSFMDGDLLLPDAEDP
ncbi:hypothetical protein DL96DRAFT_1622564 [Flagelloscypha sp. PMI_526]|nr:hypothetical protein DL96DRAFT_1622564 [Flagelloscypha sp. PMI_526]